MLNHVHYCIYVLFMVIRSINKASQNYTRFFLIKKQISVFLSAERSLRGHRKGETHIIAMCASCVEGLFQGGAKTRTLTFESTFYHTLWAYFQKSIELH